MRNLADLPRVSCQFKKSDGLADIASFRAGAKNAGWTNTQITVAVAKAIGECHVFEDVGVVLFQYCIDKSWVKCSDTAVSANRA
jgi:hypothetical protein